MADGKSEKSTVLVSNNKGLRQLVLTKQLNKLISEKNNVAGSKSAPSSPHKEQAITKEATRPPKGHVHNFKYRSFHRRTISADYLITELIPATNSSPEEEESAHLLEEKKKKAVVNSIHGISAQLQDIEKELASHQKDHVIEVGFTDEKKAQIRGNNSNKFRFHHLALRTARLVLKYNKFIVNAMRKTIWNWVVFKWVFLVLNVVIELCQATLAQENARGAISNTGYHKLIVITSFICLLISVLEIVHEAKVSQVVWQKRGCCCWFYYHGSGRQGRVFGKFSLYLGLVSLMSQFFINLTTFLTKKSFLKFDSLPLLFSVSCLVAAMTDPGDKVMVNCRIHGSCPVQCPRCEQETIT